MTADELDALDRLRLRVDGLRPPATLRDAVLQDLPARDVGARRSGGSAGGRRWSRGVARLAVGVTAAAAVVVATVHLFRGGEGAARPSPVAPPARDVEGRARARARNVALYERERERLHRDLAGKWVLIAERAPEEVEGAFKPLIVGETLASVASFAKDATHRFVFRVGDEGDVTTSVSAWSAPRFAGPGIAKALDPTGAKRVAADGTHFYRFLASDGATPFPRAMFGLATPDGAPSPRNETGGAEVFVGPEGPDLMLTPEDDAELGLARWEVPGTQTVMGVRCRRVLVSASVSAVDATGIVVACVPDVPYPDLVAMARSRHRFWEWSDTLRASLRLDAPGRPPASANAPYWIVFGNDRVLGAGASAETALAAAGSVRDVAYQRYVLPWPRPEMATPDGPSGGIAGVLEVAGVRMDAELSPDVLGAPSASTAERVQAAVGSVFVPSIDEAGWVRAGLHLAEDGVDLILDQEEPAAPPVTSGRRPSRPAGAMLRAAFARGRLAARDTPTEWRERFVRIVAYVAPR